jgi:hypothetical protein
MQKPIDVKIEGNVTTTVYEDGVSVQVHQDEDVAIAYVESVQLGAPTGVAVASAEAVDQQTDGGNE